MSSRGRLNGKSKPPIHGPGRASSASNSAKETSRSTRCMRSVPSASSPTAAVIGFARRGAQVKSTP